MLKNYIVKKLINNFKKYNKLLNFFYPLEAAPTYENF